MQETDFINMEKTDLEKLFKRQHKQLLNKESIIDNLRNELIESNKRNVLQREQFKQFRNQSGEQEIMLKQNINIEQQSNQVTKSNFEKLMFQYQEVQKTLKASQLQCQELLAKNTELNQSVKQYSEELQ